MRSAGTIPVSGSRGLRGGVQAQNGSEWGWLCSGGELGRASGLWPWGFWFGGTGVERCQALRGALVLGFPSQGFWLLSVRAGVARGGRVPSPAMRSKVPLGCGTNWDFPPLCSIPCWKSSQTPSLAASAPFPSRRGLPRLRDTGQGSSPLAWGSGRAMGAAGGVPCQLGSSLRGGDALGRWGCGMSSRTRNSHHLPVPPLVLSLAAFELVWLPAKSKMREMVGIWMGPRAGLLHLMAATQAELSRAGKLHPNLAARVGTQRPGHGKATKSSSSSQDLEHGVAVTPSITRSAAGCTCPMQTLRLRRTGSVRTAFSYYIYRDDGVGLGVFFFLPSCLESCKANPP